MHTQDGLLDENSDSAELVNLASSVHSDTTIIPDEDDNKIEDLRPFFGARDISAPPNVAQEGL